MPLRFPGSGLIGDNASFHKRGRIEALIEQVGFHLLDLPPNSPDLNPIEHPWLMRKNRINQPMPPGQSSRQVVDQAFI
ncbi:MAG: transposase [Cyanobacteria bacterium P01_D01_bin.6]